MAVDCAFYEKKVVMMIGEGCKLSCDEIPSQARIYTKDWLNDPSLDELPVYTGEGH